jgi:hypothetical protein
MLWPLYPQGKRLQYPLDRRLGEASRDDVERRKFYIYRDLNSDP